MFKSFFPHPKIFFPSLILWSIISISVWYGFNQEIGGLIGLNLDNTEPVIGLGHFITDSFILLYLYYALSVLIFALIWMKMFILFS